MEPPAYKIGDIVCGCMYYSMRDSLAGQRGTNDFLIGPVTAIFFKAEAMEWAYRIDDLQSIVMEKDIIPELCDVLDESAVSWNDTIED